MPGIKELSGKRMLLSGGHRLCPGCTAPIVAKLVLLAADTPVVVANATGCLEVSTTIYPYTAWRVPWIHSAFENAAATIAGVEAAYQSLRRQGRMKERVQFIAFGGDGGTYDIGLQALSGALERGHDMVYICYDNEAYMNTGIQRSSATPRGASTTTSPAGKVVPGKKRYRKDLTELAAAHEIPYVAQASPSHWNDLVTKIQKALAVEGPAFVNVLASCRLGWGVNPENAIEILRLAVETCFWPLYEVENGKYRVTVMPREKKPFETWLRAQSRFRHLFGAGEAPQPAGQAAAAGIVSSGGRGPDAARRAMLEELQAEVDRKWNLLLRKVEL